MTPGAAARAQSSAAARIGPIPIGLAGLSLALFVVPFAGLAARSAWGDSALLLSQPEVLRALALSLGVASLATALALLLGFPLAWVLGRFDFRGRSLLRTLVLLPMVMPPVVGGVALLAAFGRHGLLGPPLALLGLELPFTPAAAVMAATFVSAPFLITALEAGLEGVDRRLEQVAESFGASRIHVLRSVVLPALWPSLLAGLALCFARALGEFGATITFAGNLSGRTQTVPLLVYELLQTHPERAYTLGALLAIVSVGVLIVLRRSAPR